jgi:hypothetical protein
MTPNGEKSYLKTTKKGNVTINPRKEDLMSESLRRRIQSNLSDLKEAAKKKDKEKKVKRWWDDDGDGVGYEKGEVKKEETCHTTSTKPSKKPMGKGAVDASPEKVEEETCGDSSGGGEMEKKNSIKDRMKQKMLQATAEKDKQRSGLMPS